MAQTGVEKMLSRELAANPDAWQQWWNGIADCDKRFRDVDLPKDIFRLDREVLKHVLAMTILQDPNWPDRVKRRSSAIEFASGGVLINDPIDFDADPFGDKEATKIEKSYPDEASFSRRRQANYIRCFVAGHKVCLANPGRYITPQYSFDQSWEPDTNKVQALLPDGDVMDWALPAGQSTHMMTANACKVAGLTKEGTIPKRQWIKDNVVPVLERRFGIVKDIDHHMDALRHHFQVGAEFDAERARLFKERQGARGDFYEKDETAGMF